MAGMNPTLREKTFARLGGAMTVARMSTITLTTITTSTRGRIGVG